MNQTPLQLSRNQILFFRSHQQRLLPNTRTPHPQHVASSMLGVQAQVLPAALLSIATRSSHIPTPSQTLNTLLQHDSPIVRTWGQRGTVHIYDTHKHWHLISTLRLHNITPSSLSKIPPQPLLDSILHTLQTHGPLTRNDIEPLLPNDNSIPPTQIFWVLARRALISFVERRGSQQLFDLRTRRYPNLPFNPKPISETELILARNYLSSYGPATHRDAAHFFGIRISTTKRWFQTLQNSNELLPISSKNTTNDTLWALQQHETLLRQPTPQHNNLWPLRLLAGYDNLLMGHKNKSWTTPNPSDRPHIWRKGAVVMPTVLHHGEIIATWKHTQPNQNTLNISIQPLSKFNTTHHLPHIEQDLSTLKKHLGARDIVLEIAK